MSLFERIQNKILIEQSTGSTGEQEKKQERTKGADYSAQSDEIGKKKKTKYQQLRDQRTKYNVLKNKKGVYKPSIASAKAKMGERLTNITQPPNPKATQKNALNATAGRIGKLNKAQRRAARFEPGAGKERTIKVPGQETKTLKFDKDYKTRILDRITKNQEGKIDTSKKGRINRMKAGISATSPTIQGADKRPARFVNGKQYGGGRLPKPGGPNEVDFATGGKGVNKKGIRTDQAVINRMGRDASKEEIAKAKKQQAAYDDQVKANQKQLKQKGGAKYYTGKDTPLNRKVFNRPDFNLQKVYDNLSSETGGRDSRKRAKNQPTAAQVKAQIDKKYPVKMGKTGLIPDKSSGAYGSANDKVAVSADKKTRVKAPNYDELKKKNKKIVKKIKNIVKTKPSTSGLYDPFKNKIPKLDPLKPLRIPKLKPSVITKTASKSTPLLSKLAKAGMKNPKTALAVGLLGLGLYGANKNRIATNKLNKNKMLPPIGGGSKGELVEPKPISLYLQSSPSRK